MFSGTPTNDQVGTVALKVISTEAGGLSASCTFNVQVIITNDAPAVATPLTAQNANRDTAFNFAVPLPGNKARVPRPLSSGVEEDVEVVLTLSATPSLPVGSQATRLNLLVKANEDVGFMAAGQAARINIAAHPFQKYGLLHGTVAHLRVDVTDPKSSWFTAQQNGQQPTMAYRALVRLDEQVLVSPNGERLVMNPGTAAIAEVRKRRHGSGKTPAPCAGLC